MAQKGQWCWGLADRSTERVLHTQGANTKKALSLRVIWMSPLTSKSVSTQVEDLCLKDLGNIREVSNRIQCFALGSGEWVFLFGSQR